MTAAASSSAGPFRCRVRAKGGQEIAPAIGQVIRDRGLAIEGLSVERGRLDEVFREITGGEMAGGAVTKAKQKSRAGAAPAAGKGVA